MTNTQKVGFRVPRFRHVLAAMGLLTLASSGSVRASDNTVKSSKGL